MKSFLIKIIFFLIPILIYVFTIVLVDPFNYFNLTKIVNDDIKIKNNFRSNKTVSLGTILWKMNDFRHNPTENIIIGDSRAYQINTDDIMKISGESYYNLAVPGNNCDNIIDLFWYACKYNSLSKVYLSLSFDTYYPRSRNKDIFREASRKINLIYPFFTEKLLIAHAYHALKLQIKSETKHKKTNQIQIKDKNAKAKKLNDIKKQDKWEKKLTTFNRVFKRFKFPEENISKLQKIVNYCDDNKINLTFVILPSNYDIHGLIKQNGLEIEYTRFKTEIYSLGNVVDFDIDSEFTRDNENFNDPVHVKKEHYNIINAELFLDSVRKISTYNHLKPNS